MTEENAAVVAEDAAAPADTSTQEPSRDYEKEARANGWVPETEWKGDRRPAQFLDAETFVKRGEEITPFVQRQNQKLKDELAKEKADFAKRLERIEKANTVAFEAAKRQHEAEIARVKREQRAAVASGDEGEFDRLEKVKEGLEKSAPKIEETKAEPGADLAARQDKWKAENKWFESDFDLQDWAIRYSDYHGRNNPHLSFEENMAAVTAEARKRFPDKFGGAKGNGHAAVDGGGSFGGAPRKQGKTDADLPAEARSAGMKFVSQGLFKDLKAYAKTYFEENPNG